MSMMSFNALPSAAAVYGAYASVSSSVMLLKTTYYQIVPLQVQEYINSAISRFFTKRIIVEEENSLLTLIIEENDEYNYSNHLFDSFELYMATKAIPTTNCLRIFQPSNKSKQLTTKIAQQETITEFYEGVTITCTFRFRDSKDTSEKKNQQERVSSDEKQWFELCFEKEHKDVVMNSYIPFVLKQVEALENSKKDLQLYSYSGGSWSPTVLQHSSTFETLAMEPSEKKALMDDLDLFVKRRDYFKKVGRAWKRGYLLYGPPGTGKSSLVAAMANYLKFDIFDLQLMNVGSDSGLRRLLMGIENRSILVIEDIDCSINLHDRNTLADDHKPKSNSQFTLSGLLNFIDGIWSSCGDERIIIFTTNYKDKLDPALLRPGRMDMHIHMSYLTMNGFKCLASTYLDMKQQHWRFREIEELLESVEATPAEVAEELMRSCDADVCLGALVDFLKEKKRKRASVETNNVEHKTNNGESTTDEVELLPEAKRIKTNGVNVTAT
ncbi:AAA-ATPase At3g50940-like [Apium graveolens]|uniref:AAA-ATPase At3g50940-like n=1 Tax=Apium graveolens TaxID=4045 RepID=UPI003D7A53D3